MSAVISACGKYRYNLHRWVSHDGRRGRVLFVMLNPSTADAEANDPTIRKCIGFARSWGFSEVEVVNLFAFRATDPDELKRTVSPVGPENDVSTEEAVNRAEMIVVAWGGKVPKHHRWRVEHVCEYLFDADVKCLGYTKHGDPRHPLMLSYSTPLEEFDPRAGLKSWRGRP